MVIKGIRRAVLALVMGAIMASGIVLADEKKAAHEGKSSDEVAKELSNPAGSLASLFFNLEYTEYTGDLPGADDQDKWELTFQPVLPFPVGGKGRKIIFRPLVPLPFDQPLFNPENGKFEDASVNLGDITFDLVYAGTDMKDKHDGILWGVGVGGTLPTATDDDLGGDQWRLGPEIFLGMIRHWGLVGNLISNQWDLGGSNDESYSTLTAQYFYAFSLGNGWQIASSPVISYDWEADSEDAWTVPIGVGLAKTTRIGNTPWKFQLQVEKFVLQADTFGPDWLVKVSVTPVVENIFASWFR